MKSLLYRPVIVTGLLLGCLLLLQTIALGGMTWRNLQRIDIIKADIRQGNRLHALVFDLQRRFLEQPGSERSALGDAGKPVVGTVSALSAAADALSDGELLQLQRLIPALTQDSPRDVEAILAQLRDVLVRQTAEEEALLRKVYADTMLELKLALGAPLAMLVLTLAAGRVSLRRHVFRPLDNLRDLLSRLGEGQFSPVSLVAIDPSLRPLFDNYNQLVLRLSELEEEHRTHTQTLEREVRNATRTLLDQARTLGRAERLAAVGEMAASTAHELRNPLAGIQMALENMRRECRDQAMIERFQLIGSELKRMTQQLNHMLARARHVPEAPRVTDIARVIEDLVALVRHQVDERIRLDCVVEPGLTAELPETEFRQALLNLVLNATQALQETGGSVTIRAETEGRQVRVDVCDDGPGFPEALLRNGIRPFASDREHGTGLGLPMVRRFAEHIGGKLTLVNRADGHACASLVLPLVERDA